MILGVTFVASLCRWVFQLSRFLSGPHSTVSRVSHPAEEIAPGELDAWVDSLGRGGEDDMERE